MGSKRLLLFVSIVASFVFSCTDVLKGALEKAGRYTDSGDPALYITDFKAEKGDNNREALLAWTNPADTDFAGVIVLRRTDRFPVAHDDANATILYEGTGSRYRDRGLSNNTTYYYAAFAKSGASYSNEGFLCSYSVADTVAEIRARSFFLIGGSSSYSVPTTNLVADVDMYDPATQTLYAAVTSLPGPRMFCAVASMDGKIYIIGGKDGSGVSSRVDILTVDTLTWTTGTAMTSPRCALSAVIYNGRIFCLGGTTAADSSGAAATNYIYDPVSDGWTPVAENLSSARCAFSAIAFRGTLYYYGGVTTTGVYQNSGQYRSLLTNQSVALGGLLYYIGCNYAFYHKELNDDGEVAFFLTFGGTNQNNQTGLPAGGTYNFITNSVYATFIPNATGGAPAGYQIPPLVIKTGIEGFTNRAYSGCEYFGDYIYLFGGLFSGSPPSESTLIERLDVKDGDLFNGEWTSTGVGALATARYAFGITRVNY